MEKQEHGRNSSCTQEGKRQEPCHVTKRSWLAIAIPCVSHLSAKALGTTPLTPGFCCLVQMEQMRNELLQERAVRQDLECDKISLERQVRAAGPMSPPPTPPLHSMQRYRGPTLPKRGISKTISSGNVLSNIKYAWKFTAGGGRIASVFWMLKQAKF